MNASKGNVREPQRIPAQRKLCAALIIAMVACATPAWAQSDDAPQAYSISAGNLADALDQLAAQSKVQIIYPAELVRGKRAPAVEKQANWRQVLQILLSGSGLEWQLVNENTVAIRRAGNAPKNAEQPDSISSTPINTARKPVVDIEKLTVVGSRLGVLPTNSALPVKLIDRSEIERSGASSIAQVLSQLPEVSVSNAPAGNIGPAGGIDGVDINGTSVQLRGLPLGTTLILINGRRAGESSAFASTGLFDLSAIPLAMVDRIEVLPAGASAIYGGDGLAGVINIVLKQEADGFEVRVRHLTSDGYFEDQVSAVWGRAWSRGSITAMANWSRNDTLESSERQLTNGQDFRRFGGLDRRSSYYSYPANIYSLDGCPQGEPYCFVPLDNRGNLPGTNAPYATVPSGQNGTGLSPSDFAGNISTGSQVLKFKNAERIQSLLLNGSYRVGKNTEVFMDVVHSKRSIPARELQLMVLAGQYGISGTVVSSDNPFNPFGADVGIDYWFQDTGIFSSYTQNHQRLSVGAKGDLGSWHWELTNSRTRDRSKFDGPGGFDPELVGNALMAANPNVALNVFTGDGTAPATHEFLTTLVNAQNQDYASDSTEMSAFIRGALFKLPAGDVQALVGGEYRRVDLKSADDGVDGVGGADSSKAAFAELRAPLLSAGHAEARRELLATTAAVRRESIGRSNEDATTSMFGLEFRPSGSLLIRTTYSSAFKPILAYDAVRPAEIYPFPNSVRDPAFDGQEFPVQVLTGGGTPLDLKPETSTNITFGFVYAPNQSFRASLSAWRNEFNNKFEYLQLYQDQLIVDNESRYPERVIRNSDTGVIEMVDIRMINVSSIKVSGIDIAIESSWDTRFGQMEGSLAATHTSRYDAQIFPDTPVESRLAVLGDTGWAPKWKVVPRLTWIHGNTLSATLNGRYISSYKDTLPLASGPNQGTTLTLGNYWIFDLSADIGLDRWIGSRSSWLSGARLRMNVNNLTNRLPDFCNSCAYGYDATQYDIMGRATSAELIFSF